MSNLDVIGEYGDKAQCRGISIDGNTQFGHLLGYADIYAADMQVGGAKWLAHLLSVDGEQHPCRGLQVALAECLHGEACGLAQFCNSDGDGDAVVLLGELHHALPGHGRAWHDGGDGG